MKYTKRSLTIQEQAQLLIDRGLNSDYYELCEFLEYFSYYRLSGYLFPYKNSDETYNDISLEKVKKIVEFDSKLRNLVFCGIEKLEILFRSNLVNVISLEKGPFSYIEKDLIFYKLSDEKHQIILDKLKNELSRSHEVFIRHFKNKYGDQHEYPPIWMVAEILSFGSIISLYNNMDIKLQKKVIENFNIPLPVVKSWFLSLNTVRNVCAHHSRLWNKRLGIKVKLPNDRKYKDWHIVEIPNDKIFVVLTIINFFYKSIFGNPEFQDYVKELLSDYDFINFKQMGIPDNWNESPLWK